MKGGFGGGEYLGDAAMYESTRRAWTAAAQHGRHPPDVVGPSGRDRHCQLCSADDPDAETIRAEMEYAVEWLTDNGEPVPRERGDGS